MSDTPEPAAPVPTSTPASTPAPASGPAPTAATVLPAENKSRGTLLALLALPAGVIVWNIVWAIGFISGWVSLGVALFALWLYRKGSGGRIGYDGAIRLSLLTVVTLAISFFVGLAVDRITYGPYVQYSNLGLNILLLVVFAAIGVFVLFRTARTTIARQKAAESADPGSAPAA